MDRTTNFDVTMKTLITDSGILELKYQKIAGRPEVIVEGFHNLSNKEQQQIDEAYNAVYDLIISEMIEEFSLSGAKANIKGKFAGAKAAIQGDPKSQDVAIQAELQSLFSDLKRNVGTIVAQHEKNIGKLGFGPEDQVVQMLNQIKQSIEQSPAQIKIKDSSVLGRAGDVASNTVLPLVAKAISPIANKIEQLYQKSGPIKGFDDRFEGIKSQLAQKFPESAGSLDKFSKFAKNHRGKASLIIGGLTALLTATAAIGGGVGPVLLGVGLRGIYGIIAGEPPAKAFGKAAIVSLIGRLVGGAAREGWNSLFNDVDVDADSLASIDVDIPTEKLDAFASKIERALDEALEGSEHTNTPTGDGTVTMRGFNVNDVLNNLENEDRLLLRKAFMAHESSLSSNMADEKVKLYIRSVASGQNTAEGFAGYTKKLLISKFQRMNPEELEAWTQQLDKAIDTGDGVDINGATETDGLIQVKDAESAIQRILQTTGDDSLHPNAIYGGRPKISFDLTGGGMTIDDVKISFAELDGDQLRNLEAGLKAHSIDDVRIWDSMAKAARQSGAFNPDDSSVGQSTDPGGDINIDKYKDGLGDVGDPPPDAAKMYGIDVDKPMNWDDIEGSLGSPKDDLPGGQISTGEVLDNLPDVTGGEIDKEFDWNSLSDGEGETPEWLQGDGTGRTGRQIEIDDLHNDIRNYSKSQADAHRDWQAKNMGGTGADTPPVKTGPTVADIESGDADDETPEFLKKMDPDGTGRSGTQREIDALHDEIRGYAGTEADKYRDLQKSMGASGADTPPVKTGPTVADIESGDASGEDFDWDSISDEEPTIDSSNYKDKIEELQDLRDEFQRKALDPKVSERMRARYDDLVDDTDGKIDQLYDGGEEYREIEKLQAAIKSDVKEYFQFLKQTEFEPLAASDNLQFIQQTRADGVISNYLSLNNKLPIDKIDGAINKETISKLIEKIGAGDKETVARVLSFGEKEGLLPTGEFAEKLDEYEAHFRGLLSKDDLDLDR